MQRLIAMTSAPLLEDMNMRSQKKKSSGCLPLLLLLITFGFAVNTTYKVFFGGPRDWVATEARVTKVSAPRGNDTRYSYEYWDSRHERHKGSARIRFSQPNSVGKGSKITVYYDAESPGVSKIERDSSSSVGRWLDKFDELENLFIYVLIPILAGIGLIGAGKKKKR